MAEPTGPSGTPGPDPVIEVERIYRQDGDRLWRAVLVFAGDPDVASDAVAEAFAQVLRRGRAVRSPGAWVWRAAFRIAAGELKRRGRDLPAASDAAGGVAGVAPRGDEVTADLLRALARLSPKQRASVILHHYAGYPVKDVAAILGSTGPAVRVHLSRGRTRLREYLREDDHG